MIVGKTALVQEQVIKKVEIGVKEFEIQLISMQMVSDEDLKDIISILKKYNATVSAIHLPIYEDINGNLNGMSLSSMFGEGKDMMSDTVNLAKLMIDEGVSKNKIVHIVVHMYEDRGEIVSKDLVDKVGVTLNLYPFIEIDIEHCSYAPTLNGYRTVPMEQVLDVVKDVRGRFNTDRCNFLLDWCHYQIDQYFNYEPPTIKQIEEMYLPYTKRIHLSWANGDGIGRNHGNVIPNFQTYCELRDLFRRQEIVAEVMEDDHLRPENLSHMIEMEESYKYLIMRERMVVNRISNNK